jgi:LacI family transcriptional regulator/LacI family repressor for deo operon, udp, cdd, tsx, nupC, and nupG
MSVSIYDIAKAANVSPSTVSRALQGHPRIGTETKTRIQTLAKKMGYIPSAVAQSLITNKTWTIGMVVTTVADPVVADILDGVEEVAQEAGYSVFLSNSRNDPRREVAVVETFQRRRVDAVIDVASRMGSTYSAKLNQLEVPIVLVEHQEYNNYHHSVSTDNKGGAKAAIDHLLGLGHRRIGFVGAIDRPKSNDERLLGYKMALEQANIPAIPELISLPDSDHDYERGRLGLADMLAAQATAVFCYNDRTAIGLLKGWVQRGITIPQQLSIVGFDDIGTTSYLRPALTTIRQPRVKMGQIAMQMTLDLLDGQTPENATLPVELIIRQTTAEL